MSLSTSTDIQELDRKLSFIFVGNLNTHHQEWSKSMSPTNHHCIAAFNFANLSGCKSQNISLVIAWTCCLLMFQVWWIIWLILLLVILIILLFHSLCMWRWVLKFPILYFLRRCTLSAVYNSPNPVSELKKIITS